MREITTANSQAAELIQYLRPDHPGARTSTYRRIPVPPRDIPELKAALAEALQILVTVRKQRTVAIWRSTRIHIDCVDDLGRFVELETVLGEETDAAERGRAEFDSVVDWLGLANLETIPGSYSDLMLAKEGSLK